MDIQFWQIILITLYAGLAIHEGNNTTFGFVKPTMAGFFSGLILGDVQTGLFIGGTLNLLVLGVGNFGGASIPDYMTGALLGTAFSIISGESPEFGVSLAVPIGLLMIQLDVLARFTNTFLQEKAETLLEENKFKKAARLNLFGLIPTSLSRMIPVFLALTLGATHVQTIVDSIPLWLMDGLRTAGAILPALGIAILLHYLPLKINIAYLLIGFFLVAFLDVPILGVAIVGLAMAITSFQKAQNNENNQQTVVNGGVMGDE